MISLEASCLPLYGSNKDWSLVLVEYVPNPPSGPIYVLDELPATRAASGDGEGADRAAIGSECCYQCLKIRFDLCRLIIFSVNQEYLGINLW